MLLFCILIKTFVQSYDRRDASTVSCAHPRFVIHLNYNRQTTTHHTIQTKLASHKIQQVAWCSHTFLGCTHYKATPITQATLVTSIRIFTMLSSSSLCQSALCSRHTSKFYNEEEEFLSFLFFSQVTAKSLYFNQV